MPCQILVSYQCNQPTGEIIAIVEDTHIFSPVESLGSWKAADPLNTRDNWNRLFTIVKVTDKTKDELAYLNDPLLLAGAVPPEAHPSGQKKWYFSTPVNGEPAYDALNQTGEITCPFTVAEAYLLERI